MEYVSIEKDNNLLGNTVKTNSEQNLKKRININSKKVEKKTTNDDNISSNDEAKQKNTVIFSKLRQSLINFFKQFKESKVYITAVVTGAALITLGTIALRFTNEVISNEKIKEMLKDSPIKIGIISIICAPIFEELVYRKTIFGSIRKYSKPLAYIISSFLFAFEHYGFNFNFLINELKTNTINVPVFMSMGMILNFAYDYSGFILSSMLAHSINNALSLISTIFGF